MNREKFEQLVSRAIVTLPKQFLDKLENITLMVQDYPTKAQLTSARIRRNYTLLGLYEGIPLTKRGRNYSLVTPDKITIFRKPIESMYTDDVEIIAEIQEVVRHEIAHYFGTDEATLDQIEREKFKHKGKGL